MSDTYRRIVLAARPDAAVKPEHFRVETRPVPAKETRVGAEIREGLALVLNHPVLRPLTLVSTSWFIVFQGWIALQTLYATRELGLSAGQLGVAHMIGGAGALVSAVLARHITRRLGAGVPILAGVACSAVAWLLLALMPRTDRSVVGLGVVLFVFDFGVMLYWINYASLRQSVTPDRLLGRMTATMRFFTVAAAPLGGLAAGRAADAFGLRPTFAGMAVLVLGMVALLALRTDLRKVADLSHAAARDPSATVGPAAAGGRTTTTASARPASGRPLPRQSGTNLLP